MKCFKLMMLCLSLAVFLLPSCEKVEDPGYPGYIGYDNGICSRGGLHQMASDFFDALTAHDPSGLPLAQTVRYTENGIQKQVGDGLWANANTVQFTRNAIDIERCSVHSQAVLSEGEHVIIYGVRLQIADGLIDEIESYIAREGDYKVLGVTLFNPEKLMKSDDDDLTEIHWEHLVPEDRRCTRDELNTYADEYFNSFGNEVLSPMTEDCYRWENGAKTTFGDCSLFTFANGADIVSRELGDILGAPEITKRRYPLTDVEAGIVVSYVLFADRVDFHMFKVFDNKVHLIQAVISEAGHSSTGWEDDAHPPVE